MIAPGGEGAGNAEILLKSAIDDLVRTAATPNSPVAQRANTIANEFMRRPDWWRFCFQLFASRETAEVDTRFWCIKHLSQNVLQLTLEDRAELRLLVTSFISEVLVGHIEDDGRKLAAEAFPLRTYMWLLFVRLIIADYPMRWASPFEWLLSLSSRRMPGLEVVLGILSMLDEEVVSELNERNELERTRHTEIKDSMKISDIPKIVHMWKHVIAFEPMQSSHPALVAETLRIASLYVPWIDARLVSEKSFLHSLMELLKVGVRDHGSLQDRVLIAAQCLEFFTALAYKRMDAARKIVLFRELELIQNLIATLEGACCQTEEFLAPFAKLFDTIGEQLVVSSEALLNNPDVVARQAASASIGGTQWPCVDGESLEALESEAFYLLSQVRQVVSVLFAHPSVVVSENVERFLSDYAKHLKLIALPQLTAKGDQAGLQVLEKFVLDILKLLVGKVQYPPWYSPSAESSNPLSPSRDFDEDSEFMDFLDFREAMSAIFRRFFAISDKVGMQFLSEVTSALCQALTAGCDVDFRQAEAALHVLVLAADDLKNLNKILKDTNHPLCVCLAELATCCSLLNFPHRDIQIAFIDLVRRYEYFFVNDPQHCAAVRTQLLGASGIRSPDTVVVARSSTTLTKFCRTSLAPFVEEIVTSVADLLPLKFNRKGLKFAGVSDNTAETSPFTFDDLCRLYESLSYLIASPKCHNSFSAENRQKALQDTLLAPLIHFIQEMVSGCRPDQLSRLSSSIGAIDPIAAQEFVATIANTLNTTSGVVADYFAAAVTLMASASKGWGDRRCPEFSAIWLSALRSARDAFQLFTVYPQARSSTIFLCRRIVSILPASPEAVDSVSSIVEMLLIALSAAKKPAPLETSLGVGNAKAAQAVPSPSSTVELVQLSAFLSQLAIHWKSDAEGVFCREVQSILLSSAQGESRFLYSVYVRENFRLWRNWEAESPSMEREKAQDLEAYFQSIHSIATNTPAAIVRLMSVISPSARVFDPLHAGLAPLNASAEVSAACRVELLQLLLFGCSMPLGASPSIWGMCMSVQRLVLAHVIATSRNSGELRHALEALHIEVAMTRAIESLTVTDANDAQHDRYLRDFADFFRFYCGKSKDDGAVAQKFLKDFADVQRAMEASASARFAAVLTSLGSADQASSVTVLQGIWDACDNRQAAAVIRMALPARAPVPGVKLSGFSSGPPLASSSTRCSTSSSELGKPLTINPF